MTEIEFLQREADHARGSMRQQLKSLRHRVEHDPRLQRQTARHPWMTTGVAAAAGLVVGGLFASRAGRQRSSGRGSTTGWGSQLLGGWLKGALAGPLVEVVQTILATITVTLLGSQQAKHDGNGHAPLSSTDPSRPAA